MADEDLAKVKQDLIEIEDLVYQMLFFTHESQGAEYKKVLITNLAKKILDFLQIEHDDVEHLFKHELDRHNYDVHVTNEKAEQLHNTLVEQHDAIKKAVSEIPKTCQQLADGKLDNERFRKKIEQSCSNILKLVGSEDHELGFMKEFFAPEEAADPLK